MPRTFPHMTWTLQADKHINFDVLKVFETYQAHFHLQNWDNNWGLGPWMFISASVTCIEQLVFSAAQLLPTWPLPFHFKQLGHWLVTRTLLVTKGIAARITAWNKDSTSNKGHRYLDAWIPLNAAEIRVFCVAHPGFKPGPSGLTHASFISCEAEWDSNHFMCTGFTWCKESHRIHTFFQEHLLIWRCGRKGSSHVRKSNHINLRYRIWGWDMLTSWFLLGWLSPV